MEIMIIPGILTFFAGVIFIIIGFKSKGMNDSGQKNWILVKGQIVQIRTHRNWGGKKIFTPIVLFYTVQGQKLYCQGTGTQITTYHTNQFVEVSYNPNNPAQAEIKNDSGKKFGKIVFVGVGTMMLLTGLLFGGIAFIFFISRFL